MDSDFDIYVYKMVADNGGAPCVFRGLLSLAICKPKIRKAARKGALIFGFGSKRYSERLIYIAKITEDKPELGDYYRNPKYAQRDDCIYQDIAGLPQRKPGARYHAQTDERLRDVGRHFERAYVLLSKDFRYLGKLGTADYKERFPAIKALIEGLKRNHRVNHKPELRRQLLKLKSFIWRQHKQMKVGSPTDAESTATCNTDTPGCTVS